jgi:O-methyltransferase
MRVALVVSPYPLARLSDTKTSHGPVRPAPRSRVKAFVRNCLRRIGYELVPTHRLPPDLTEGERQIVSAVRPYTLTTVDRLVGLIQATTYIVRNGIAGDFVECGVWRGGSMMAVALTLLELGETSRHLYLYDTFAGMPAPTARDRDLEGRSAAALLDNASTVDEVRCVADLEDVRRNIERTGYPVSRVAFVRGRVEETLPGTMPERVALLRLDTDWYESTKHELTHLYPRLSTGGVLILDDYGHWRGAREAADEYFARRGLAPILVRLDYTGRLTLKLEA